MINLKSPRITLVVSFLFSSGLADIVNTTLYQTQPIFTGLWHGNLYHINPLKTAEITAITQSRTLQWRHNGHSGVSNHQPHDCFLNLLFRRKSKETSKPRVTGLCVGDSPMSVEFPAQMASNAENVSIWWRHHDKILRLFKWTIQYIIMLCNHCISPTWRRYPMETRSALLALCEGYPSATGGFPSQRASSAELWWFFGIRLKKCDLLFIIHSINDKWDRQSLFCKDANIHQCRLAYQVILYHPRMSRRVFISRVEYGTRPSMTARRARLGPSDPVTIVLALAPMKEHRYFPRKKSIYTFVKTAAVLTFERFSIDY